MILWLVGFFALLGMGSLIHILPIIGVVLIGVWLLAGKKLQKLLQFPFFIVLSSHKKVRIANVLGMKLR